MNKDTKEKRDRLVKILIFPIKEISIPEDYEAALLAMNIWPTNYEVEACQSMIDSKRFQRGNVVYRTKAKRLEYVNYYGEVVVP